jgi:hypothetical protein
VESVYQLEHTLHAAINAYQPRDILEYHTAHELAMTSISDGRLEVLEAAILGTAGVLNPTPFQRAERELITLFEGLNSHLVKTVFDFGPNAHDLSGGFDLSPPVLLLALRLLVNRTRPVSSNPLVPTPKIDWPPLPETAEEQQAEFDQLIERHFGEPLDAQISVKEQLQDLRAHVDQVDARITHSEASRAIGNIDTVLATKQRVQNRRWGLLEQLRLLKSRPDHEIEPLPEPTDETNPSA